MTFRDSKRDPAIFASSAIFHLSNSRNCKNSGGNPPNVDFISEKMDLSDQLNSSVCLDFQLTANARSLTNEEWLDSVEAAAYLKVSVGALRNMTSNGLIPYHKLGSRNRYRTEELRQLLLSNARGVRNGY